MAVVKRNNETRIDASLVKPGLFPPNIDALSKDDLIKLAESLGFEPDWMDDGESILGVALWNAPDGSVHTLATLADAVTAVITKRSS